MTQIDQLNVFWKIVAVRQFLQCVPFTRFPFVVLEQHMPLHLVKQI